MPPHAAASFAGIVDLAAGPGGSVLGALKGLGSDGYFGAVGFDAAASLDPRFGEGGYTAPLTLPWEGFNPEAQAEAVAVEPGGAVLVAGYSREGIRRPTSFSPLLARYSANGVLDSTFGVGGLVGTRSVSEGGIVYHDVAVQPDGTIIAIGGRNEFWRGFESPAGVVDAYRPDGSPDTSFGRAGRALLEGGPHRNHTSLWGVELLPDSNKLLVAGYLEHHLLLARLLPNGRLDRGFGDGDGKVTVDLHSGTCCPPAAPALVADGRIVVAVTGGSNQKQRVVLARFRPGGGLDRSFGDRGIAAPFRPWRLIDAHGLVVQPDESIVTVGRSETTKRNRKAAFAVFRNRPDGSPDRGFGKEGLQNYHVGRQSLAGAALGLADGSVLVGGSALFAPGGGAPRGTGLLLDQLPSPQAREAAEPEPCPTWFDEAVRLGPGRPHAVELGGLRGVAVCRYTGNANGAEGPGLPPNDKLATEEVVEQPHTARSLGRSFNRLRPFPAQDAPYPDGIPPMYLCSAEFGGGFYLQFRYADGRRSSVEVVPSGCPRAVPGRKGDWRWLSGDLRLRLMEIAPLP
jgi:uncharacterized delta-60 repeat protein